VEGREGSCVAMLAPGCTRVPSLACLWVSCRARLPCVHVCSCAECARVCVLVAVTGAGDVLQGGRMLAKFLETNTTLIRLQLSVTDDIELPELAAVAAILQRNKVRHG
jgi:hypothetical protein